MNALFAKKSLDFQKKKHFANAFQTLKSWEKGVKTETERTAQKKRKK